MRWWNKLFGKNQLPSSNVNISALNRKLREMEERDPDEQIRIDWEKQIVRDGRGRFRGFVFESKDEAYDQHKLRARLARVDESILSKETATAIFISIMKHDFNVVPRDGNFVTWFPLLETTREAE